MLLIGVERLTNRVIGKLLARIHHLHLVAGSNLQIGCCRARYDEFALG